MQPGEGAGTVEERIHGNSHVASQSGGSDIRGKIGQIGGHAAEVVAGDDAESGWRASDGKWLGTTQKVDGGGKTVRGWRAKDRQWPVEERVALAGGGNTRANCQARELRATSWQAHGSPPNAASQGPNRGLAEILAKTIA